MQMNLSVKRFLACVVTILSLTVSARPWVAIFGSKDCGDCNHIKHEWVRDYKMPDGPILVFLPIEHEENYNLLSRLEDIIQPESLGASFPVFLVGTQFIPDIAAFRKLKPDIAKLAATAKVIPANAQIADAADRADAIIVTLLAKRHFKPALPKTTPPQQTLTPAKVAFFEQKSCTKCSRQLKELDILAHEIPSLQIVRFDIATIDGMVMLTRFRNRFNQQESTESLAPMVCWADGYVTGRLAKAHEIRDALRKSSTVPFWEAPVTDDERRAERKHQISNLDNYIITTVISGGLADGINPCAFATIIFLISYLLMKKRTKREIAAVGLSFCVGVFVCYLCIGLGLSFLIDFINKYTWLKTATYLIFAAVTAVFAFAHLRDAVRVRRTGNAGDMEVGLSKETHRGIHSIIRQLTTHTSWLMCPAALLLGAIISAMELVCTGQVLFPVLAAINASGVTMRSFYLLIVYNICFITPLALVTVLACCGIGAKAIADWARAHLFKTKLIMAAVMLLITVLMVALAFI